MYKYKLLIVKNRYDKKLSLNKYLNWFKENNLIEIVTEEIDTDFDVTTEKIKNATFSGVICGDDIYDKLRTVVPEGKYNAVVFIYGNDLNGIRVNVSKVLPLYAGTDLIQLCTLKDNGKALNHEIFHTFIHRLQRQQVMIEDPMDSVIVDGVIRAYYNNDVFDLKIKSNRTKAIERIGNNWDKVAKILVLDSKPIVKIKRVVDNGTETLGKLEYGNFTCKTLEKPYKDNQKNISCIPTGIYDVEYTFSPKFMKYTYEIKKVPNRTSIRIHSGNYFFDIEGCILLGSGFGDINKDGTMDILNSRSTVKSFEELMGKKPFTLVIS